MSFMNAIIHGAPIITEHPSIILAGMQGSGKTTFLLYHVSKKRKSEDIVYFCPKDKRNADEKSVLLKTGGIKATRKKEILTDRLVYRDKTRLTDRTIVDQIHFVDDRGGNFHGWLETGEVVDKKPFQDAFLFVVIDINSLTASCEYYNPRLCRDLSFAKNCSHYSKVYCDRRCADAAFKGCGGCVKFNVNKCALMQRQGARNLMKSVCTLAVEANCKPYFIITHAAGATSQEMHKAKHFLFEQIEEIFEGLARPEIFFTDAIAAIKGDEQWAKKTTQPFLSVMDDFLVRRTIRESKGLAKLAFGCNEDTIRSLRQAIAKELNS